MIYIKLDARFVAPPTFFIYNFIKLLPLAKDYLINPFLKNAE